MEFAPWRRLRSFVKSSDDDFSCYESQCGAAHVRVALTGVGGARAKKLARQALVWQPSICISAGLAGSLSKEHRRGDVIVARNIVELESGRTVMADHDLLKHAESCGSATIQRMITSSSMILSAEGKRRLGNMGEAVEMESFEVASEAADRGIPAIAIRAISDEVDEDLPIDFSRVLDEKGSVDKSEVIRSLAKAPHKLPALVRLGSHSRAASAKLAEFLERYVSTLVGAESAEIVGAERA